MTTKAFDQEISPEEQRYLVAGATGLVGRHVVREIAGRGWPVRAMRRWDSTVEGLDFDDVETVVADIFDPTPLAEAVAGVNVVVYCVAPEEGLDDGRILRRSVEGIRRMLQACREHGIDRLVLTSSASTMGRGRPEERLTEQCFYLPGSSRDPFAEAKYAVEQECFRYVADGFPVVILNPTLVVGPGVDLTRYARLDVGSRQPMNVVDVREVARMHAEAVVRGRPGARYLIGGENTTAGAVFEGWPGRGKNEGRPREAYLVECGQWVDCTLAREELGL